MKDKKKCFVIMPFAQAGSQAEQKWTEIFDHTIKPAVEESRCGHKCERYKFRRANIIKDILQELNSAPVVIADLTNSNPNVLWELGVRHTLSKRTILVAQNEKFLPSDLKDYPIITYKYKQTPTEAHKFRREIKDKLKDIEADPEKSDSPVADFLKDKNRYLLEYAKLANLKKLTSLIAEVSYNIVQSDVILKHVKQTQTERKKGKKIGHRTTPVRLRSECLELLATTQYILLPKDLLELIVDTGDTIRLVNRNLDMWWEVGKEVEGRLLKVLSDTDKWLGALLGILSSFRLDYVNNNYIEPKIPDILLSSPKHQKFIEASK